MDKEIRAREIPGSGSLLKFRKASQDTCAYCLLVHQCCRGEERRRQRRKAFYARVASHCRLLPLSNNKARGDVPYGLGALVREILRDPRVRRSATENLKLEHLVGAEVMRRQAEASGENLVVAALLDRAEDEVEFDDVDFDDEEN